MDSKTHVMTSLWVKTPRLRPADSANVTVPLLCPWLQHLKCEGSMQTVVFIRFIMFSVQDTDESLQFSSFTLCCFFTVCCCCLSHFYNSFQVLISELWLLWKNYLYTTNFAKVCCTYMSLLCFLLICSLYLYIEMYELRIVYFLIKP